MFDIAVVYGYGFELPEIKNVLEFILKHKESFCNGKKEEKIYNQVEEFLKSAFGYDDDEVTNLFKNYYCYATGQCGLGAAVSNIMFTETGIRFNYCVSGADDIEAVLFPQTMPWNLNEIERNLTLKELEDIMLPYVKELGLTDFDLDDIEVFYE